MYPNPALTYLGRAKIAVRAQEDASIDVVYGWQATQGCMTFIIVGVEARGLRQ